jgi:predicted regulator of Ras-like GTPase activity (Roadblock/LC7/MglB family)
MSLASLHRQAPAGLFKPLPAGDKRMVEVPLSEVFKHVKSTALKRRNDQRNIELADEDLELPVFNSRKESKPAARAAAPLAKAEAPSDSEPKLAPEAKPEPAPSAMRVVAPPSGMTAAAPKAEQATKATKPNATPIAPSVSGEATILVPLAKISGDWPEEISSQLGGLDPATNVAIPHSCIAPGLARGKISCTWQQLRSWVTPPPPKDIVLDPETTIPLPLKVLAPAFLAATKSAPTGRKSVALDETIPALFTGGNQRSQQTEEAKAASEPTPTPAPTAEAPTVAERTEAKPEAPVESAAPSPTECKAPAEENSAPSIQLETPGEPATEAKLSPPAEAPVESAPSESAKAVETPPAGTSITGPAPATSGEPAAQTVGQVLGEPDRTNWTPAAIVNAVVKLPGVAGAVVALDEGFPVANALPEGVNAETVAAFLPQIFTRLNQYAGEMKLGDVDDLLFTTRGAHCLIYRLGSLYFAVLGNPGASLPWNALRIAAAELSRQVTK